MERRECGCNPIIVVNGPVGSQFLQRLMGPVQEHTQLMRKMSLLLRDGPRRHTYKLYCPIDVILAAKKVVGEGMGEES